MRIVYTSKCDHFSVRSRVGSPVSYPTSLTPINTILFQVISSLKFQLNYAKHDPWRLADFSQKESSKEPFSHIEKDRPIRAPKECAYHAGCNNFLASCTKISMQPYRYNIMRKIFEQICQTTSSDYVQDPVVQILCFQIIKASICAIHRKEEPSRFWTKFHDKMSINYFYRYFLFFVSWLNFV